MDALAHPWRALRQAPWIDLVWADLPPLSRGLTDGRARIWLSKGLLQRERRSTLAHELIHVRHGHCGCQPARVERAVRRTAARWLLPDLAIVLDEVVFYRGDTELAAEALWVDRLTVEARLDTTNPAERALIRARFEECLHA